MTMIAAYPPDHPRAYSGILAEMQPDDAGTLRSTYGRQTIEEIGAETPGARLMTLAAWRAEAATRQAQTIAKWIPCDHATVTRALEVLPPLAWNGRSFAVSEPVDHDFATGAPRFDAYRDSERQPARSSRPVTLAELQSNRYTPLRAPWTDGQRRPWRAEPADGETCPACGSRLVWGAGAACPNDCPEVDR